MNYTERDVISFVKENDVKFIRLAFTDLAGNLKNIAIMPSELPEALKTGIPTDPCTFFGTGSYDHDDIFLVPDTSTLSVLPWRPKTGRVIRFFCSLKSSDGTPFTGDMRSKLKETADLLTMKGYSCSVETECQFYLFELDENGEPTHKTADKAGYLDTAPLDKCENIRREICLSLDEMEISPETSGHTHGYGQNSITIRNTDVLSAADSHIHLRSAVKSIAAQNGMHASFMPYPLREQPRSSLVISFSLTRNDKDIFSGDNSDITDEGKSFMAGILARASEITSFLNPLTNSYHRNGVVSEPDFIAWDHQRREYLMRTVTASNGGRKLELRLADPSCCIYTALNLILRAGLEGIENNSELPPASLKRKRIPSSLSKAVQASSASSFVREYIPESVLKSVFSKMKNDAEKTERSDDAEAAEDFLYFKYI